MPQPSPRLASFAAADGYRCAVRIWDPPVAHGRVVLLHGIVSHGGWYLRSCRYLAAAGFEVHALDRRGSGLNMAARGDVPDVHTWCRDVRGYLAALPPHVPTVLAGISWGGKLAAALAAAMPDLAGLALICPGLYASQQAGWWRRGLLHTANRVGLAGRQIAIPLRDPALFTDAAYWQRYIETDPLTLRRITLRFALADLRLNQLARGAAEAIRTPVLLMLAGRERIVDNGRTRCFFQRIAAADKQCLEYPGTGHTLEFEDDPMPYLQDLCDWVARVTQSAAPVTHDLRAQ